MKNSNQFILQKYEKIASLTNILIFKSKRIEHLQSCKMRIASLVFGLIMTVDCFSQSVYMHEAQEESSGSDLFDTILGAVIFFLIIYVIGNISSNINKKKEIKKKMLQEQEYESKRKRDEEKRIEYNRNRQEFIKSLICPNLMYIDGFPAVDLGIGDKFNKLLFSTENLGAKTPCENGKIYGWGMNIPAREQSLWNYEYCPLKMTSLEDLEIQWDCYKHDAASKEMGGLWGTPTAEDFNCLINSCQWIKIADFGIKGWKVVGPNGNFIFIPYDENNNDCLLLTRSASLDESKEDTTEIGKTKYAQFLQIYDLKFNNNKPHLIEKQRIRVGFIRPVAYSEAWPKYTNSITEKSPLSKQVDTAQLVNHTQS